MSEWTRPAQPVRCVVELDKPLAVHRERGVLAQGDANANAIVAEVYSTVGKPYDLTGCMVQLIFVRPDNNALPAINAEISGNTATATLPDNAYAMSGMYSLRMQLRKSGAERTIVWIVGEVKSVDVDGIADPDHVISIGDIMASAKEAQTAASNANAAAQRANAGAERAEQLQIDASGLAGDSNKLGGKPPEAYSAVNLLDNSDWRVKDRIINQRGKTAYSGIKKYTIDRWYIYKNSTTDGILTIENNGISVDGFLYQLLDINKINENTVYTLAVKKTDETFVIYSSTFENSTGPTTFYFSGNYAVVRIASGSYLWAALYEGTYTADTLPPYVQPDPTVELAKCRRYAFVPTVSGEMYVTAVITNATTARLFFDLPEQMRTDAVPSVTIGGIGWLNCDGKTVSGQSYTIGNKSCIGNQLTVDIVFASAILTANHVGVAKLTGGVAFYNDL